MATGWTSDNVYYTDVAQAICDRVKELSGGRLVITPYPAGEIVEPLEIMDAVSKGTVEIGHSWSGYWVDQDRSFELFSSIPNQMVAQEWMVWMYGPPKGIELWQNLYADYNIVPFPGGINGPEFGFFTNRPVRTLEDFQGLKLRVTGLAAEVVRELGATVVTLASGDIKNAMRQGQIDGFEFSTPAVDWPMGFQEVAPYVSLPSWHQPSSMLETIVNQDAYNKLPDDLQAILEAACKEVGMIDYQTKLEGDNSTYFNKFVQYGTQITTLDSQAVQKISDITKNLADAQAAQNPFYAEVLQSQRDFIASYRQWEAWSDYSLYPNQSDVDKALSQAQQTVQNELDQLDQNLAVVAAQLSGLDLAGEQAQNIISGLLTNRPYIADVSTVDRNGILVTVEPADYQQYVGSDISSQEQVIRLFRTQQPVLSQNFTSVEGFEAADLEYPVFSSNHDVVGAVSVLFKPDVLLGNIISTIVQGQDYDIWSMQLDGEITYDVDPREIGQNLFVDSIYEPYPSLIALGKEIAANKAGIGQYEFLNNGLQKMVKKSARWNTVSLHDTEWRLVLIQVAP